MSYHRCRIFKAAVKWLEKAGENLFCQEETQAGRLTPVIGIPYSDPQEPSEKG